MLTSTSPHSAHKVFMRGAFVSLFGVLFAGVISYFTRRFMVLNLRPEEYGFFYSAFSLASICLAVVDLGMGKSGTILLAKYSAKGKKYQVNLFFSMVFYLKLSIGLLFGLLLWLLTPYLLTNYFHFYEGMTTLYCFCLFIPLQALGGFVINSLGAVKDFRSRSLIQVAYYGLIFLPIVCLVREYGTFAAILSYCGAAGTVICCGLFYLYKKYDLHLVFNVGHFQSAWYEMWNYVKWVMFSVAALAILNYVDTLMLTWLCGLKSVAGYHVVLPIVQITQSLMFLPIIFLPIATELWQQQRLAQINTICSVVSLLMVVCLGVSLLFLIPFSESVITILFEKSYVWVAPALVVLGCGTPILVLAHFYLNVINSVEKPRVAFYTTLAGLLSNILLNLCLIPYFDIVGASVATLLSYLLIAVVALRSLRHYTGLILPWLRMIWLCGSAFFMAGLIVAMKYLYDTGGFNLVVVVSVLICYCLISWLVVKPVLEVAGMKSGKITNLFH